MIRRELIIMVKLMGHRKSVVITVLIIVVVLILVPLYLMNKRQTANNNQSTNPNSPPTDSSILQPGQSPDVSPAKEVEIKKMLDSMSIDEKLGQMIIGGYDNIDEMLPIIRENKLGGAILYKKNISSVSQTRMDILSLKENNVQNKIPIFISVDQEGGEISRLPSEMGTFESALSIGNRDDPTYAFNSGVKIAKAIKQLGFNLDFAPVLDIFSNPKNTVIADRAFGTTPDRVSKIGIQVLKGLRSETIIPTAKHFPGHGDTAIDSHVGLPVVNKSLDQLNNLEFKPFIEAIKNNVEMIMIAHIKLSKVEDLPSSLSNKVVTGILRKQLGFKGVIITDDMTMGAITQTYNLSDASIMAVKAGCDIVLVAKGAQNSILVLNSLKSAYQKGQLTEQRINESVYRILSLKEKYGLATPSPSGAQTTDTMKDVLVNMRQLAEQGKVINSTFPVKTTSLEAIKKNWGEPDTNEWVAAAKGTYATYSSHALAFGYNNGSQIFEVRSFDKQLQKLSLAKTKEVYGTPAYDVKTKDEEIIGYTAGEDYKIEFVFSMPTASNANPMMDHYLVFYPSGTVNSITGDLGRQW